MAAVPARLLTVPFQENFDQVVSILWNLYIYELESHLCYLLWKDLSSFQLLSYLALLDETNRIRKIGNITTIFKIAIYF
jgi:hypothetical protein